MEKLVATKDTSPLVAESLDDIMQCPFMNPPTGVQLAIYKVVEQGLLHLLRRCGTGETLNIHVPTNFSFTNGANPVRGKLLPAKAFVTPIAAFLEHKSGQATKMESSITKML